MRSASTCCAIFAIPVLIEIEAGAKDVGRETWRRDGYLRRGLGRNFDLIKIRIQKRSTRGLSQSK